MDRDAICEEGSDAERVRGLNPSIGVTSCGVRLGVASPAIFCRRLSPEAVENPLFN
jgi:hypothetical protein